jgi:GTPase
VAVRPLSGSWARPFFLLWAFTNGLKTSRRLPSYPQWRTHVDTSLLTLHSRGMELGLALRLVAPPPLLPCLSRRALSLPPDFVSSRVLRGRRIHASRLKHGAGVVCNAIMTYSGVEEEEMVEEEMEEEAEPAVSTRPRLELIEKPDRSLALLDEYESEELGTSLCANHRSG